MNDFWILCDLFNDDVNIVAKVIQDGLNRIAYEDDKQIVELHARKIINSTFNGVIIEVKEVA